MRHPLYLSSPFSADGALGQSESARSSRLGAARRLPPALGCLGMHRSHFTRFGVRFDQTGQRQVRPRSEARGRARARPRERARNPNVRPPRPRKSADWLTPPASFTPTASVSARPSGGPAAVACEAAQIAPVASALSVTVTVAHPLCAPPPLRGPRLLGRFGRVPALRPPPCRRLFCDARRRLGAGLRRSEMTPFHFDDHGRSIPPCHESGDRPPFPSPPFPVAVCIAAFWLRV